MLREGPGKVTKFFCDLCKVNESDTLLMLRDRVIKDWNSTKVLKWDICKECIQKIHDTLGPGRSNNN